MLRPEGVGLILLRLFAPEIPVHGKYKLGSRLINCSTRALTPLLIFLRSVVFLLTVVMFLSSPSENAHAFTAHFRNPEVRRVIARHLFLTQTEDINSDDLIQVEREAIPLPALIDPPGDGRPAVNPNLVPCVSLARLYSRLKLGQSRSNSQDPLS